ncbi:hypothetical protein DERP_008517 [Dermatophagoides pteronyssinus]|uniref:Uncharacterized protein n=1 Tax=Dermatophagoides pteronyssinus TaxID=6956 RepID=A0ABQ8IVG3_DERPT|nr:hypothetical protein DERP_008517 [Dermatophagoides pteronyssinus]
MINFKHYNQRRSTSSSLCNTNVYRFKSTMFGDYKLMSLSMTMIITVIIIIITTTTLQVMAIPKNHHLPLQNFDLPISKCNKTHADQIVRWLYFFDDPDRIAPDNADAFEQFCNQTNQKELYVKEYARRCLAKFPRQVTSLLMFGIIRKNRQFCSKTRLRKEMIHAAHCLNTIKRKGSKCFSRSIQDFLIIKHMPISGRVGKTCCVYYQLEECLVQQAIETPQSCSSEDAQMIENLIEGYTGQVVSSICQNYPKSHDSCSKLLQKKEMNKLKKLISNEMTKTYSILPPLIDILDSIPP